MTRHHFILSDLIKSLKTGFKMCISSNLREAGHLHTCSVRNYSFRFARPVIDEVAESNAEE